MSERIVIACLSIFIILQIAAAKSFIYAGDSFGILRSYFLSPVIVAPNIAILAWGAWFSWFNKSVASDVRLIIQVLTAADLALIAIIWIVRPV